MGQILLCPSQLLYYNGIACIMSSFLHACKCTTLHTFFYDGKFYFWMKKLIVIRVWAQLCCGCQGEESPMKVVFHKRSSSTKGYLPLKVALHWRSSSTKDRPLPKVIFHQWLSSNESCLPSKVVFHWWLSSTDGCLPPKVIVNQP